MKKLATLFALSALTLASCSKEEKKPEAAAEQANKPDSVTVALAEQAKSLFGMIPATMPGAENDTPDLIALGKKLYFETALSKNNTQSCNSCHNVENAGVDNLPTSPGAFGKNGNRNSPTVYNAGYHFVQFWDGRAADLAEQAKGPILNPVEMAMPSEKEVEKRISGMAEYPDMFAKAFPADKKPVSYDNIAKAIAAFERTLRTHDRFDDFLNGDMAALNADEVKGLQTFVETGCITCHTGSLMGGHMYQKMGLVNAYSNTTDKGRFEVTKNEGDMFMFKVPSLRNVALTAPYFHDGGAATLENAVEQMAWLQLGKKLAPEEVKSITTFLHALSDKDMAAKQKGVAVK